MAVSIIILAAGQGTRMYSALPKVLHELAGKPLLRHVIDAALAAEADMIHVVYGHGGQVLRTRVADSRVEWVEQAEQLGTGDAVGRALPQVPEQDTVLVLYGDVPLISPATIQRLRDAAGNDGVSLLTAELDDPKGYGRILRDQEGQVRAIVEQKDAGPEELRIREINTGFLAAPAGSLKRWLAALTNDNAQGEYYLTDIVAQAVAEGLVIHTIGPDQPYEILGINDRAQLAQLERIYQRRQAEEWMRAGLTLRDPDRFDLRGSLRAGTDVTIDVNVVLEGEIQLDNGVTIGPNSVLRNVQVGAGTRIEAHCHLEDAVIGKEARIGPFARVRPGAQLADRVHLGNFVEIKKSTVGEGSKINHLSYVGDSQVGRDVNIGAGTITCNYDGANKHLTVIGDGAFIGSDTQLVAPVTVGPGATIGAGSTITRDAPADQLTLSRAPQTTREGWQRPVKRKPGEGS